MALIEAQLGPPAVHHIDGGAFQLQNSSMDARYLIFELGNTNYAIPSIFLDRVARVTKVRNLPNVPRWIAGICNLRGQIVSLVDVRQLMSLPPITARRAYWTIVVHSIDESFSAGLVVDRVLGIRHLHPDAEMAYSNHHTQMVLDEYQQPVQLIEMNWLFQAIRLPHHPH